MLILLLPHWFFLSNLPQDLCTCFPLTLGCSFSRSFYNLQFSDKIFKFYACNAGDPGSIPCIRKIPWRRKWQSTPALLSGKSHGRRSLIGYSPWGRKELDTTERLQFQFPSIPTIKRTQEAMSSVGLQRAQFWVREEQNGELLSLKMEGAFVILHSKYPI